MKSKIIRDNGYKAALMGKPIDCPYKGEFKRAAWEIGWREGKKQRILNGKHI